MAPLETDDEASDQRGWWDRERKMRPASAEFKPRTILNAEIRSFDRALVAPLFLAAGAQAHSLKQREMITRDSAKVADLGREANQACGTNIKFQVDYASHAGVLDDNNNQSPWAYLANATYALKRVCRSDAGKQAVRAKIASFMWQIARPKRKHSALANFATRSRTVAIAQTR
jgi:hypothetical protein